MQSSYRGHAGKQSFKNGFGSKFLQKVYEPYNNEPSYNNYDSQYDSNMPTTFPQTPQSSQSSFMKNMNFQSPRMNSYPPDPPVPVDYNRPENFYSNSGSSSRIDSDIGEEYYEDDVPEHYGGSNGQCYGGDCQCSSPCEGCCCGSCNCECSCNGSCNDCSYNGCSCGGCPCDGCCSCNGGSCSCGRCSDSYGGQSPCSCRDCESQCCCCDGKNGKDMDYQDCSHCQGCCQGCECCNGDCGYNEPQYGGLPNSQRYSQMNSSPHNDMYSGPPSMISQQPSHQASIDQYSQLPGRDLSPYTEIQELPPPRQSGSQFGQDRDYNSYTEMHELPPPRQSATQQYGQMSAKELTPYTEIEELPPRQSGTQRFDHMSGKRLSPYTEIQELPPQVSGMQQFGQMSTKELSPYTEIQELPPLQNGMQHFDQIPRGKGMSRYTEIHELPPHSSSMQQYQGNGKSMSPYTEIQELPPPPPPPSPPRQQQYSQMPIKDMPPYTEIQELPPVMMPPKFASDMSMSPMHMQGKNMPPPPSRIPMRQTFQNLREPEHNLPPPPPPVPILAPMHRFQERRRSPSNLYMVHEDLLDDVPLPPPALKQRPIFQDSPRLRSKKYGGRPQFLDSLSYSEGC